MRTPVSNAIIVFILQFCAAVYERNHGRKRKDHNLQTVKYQEHRDVSLLYGNTKDIEDSRQQRVHHLDGYESVAPSIKLLKSLTKHHVNPRMRLDKRNSSDIGKPKQVVKAHSSVHAIQGSDKAALTTKVLVHNSEKSTKRNSFPAESRGDILPSIKRYRIPSRRVHHRHTEARKRAKVEEVLRKERQKIDKTIDLLDNLPEAYSRGIDVDGMDINEVNMIDNNTLSDYFHALNDNGSGANNNDNNNENDASVYTTTTSSTPSKLTWDEVTPSDTEDGNSGNDDFYDAIDNGEPPPPLKMKNTRPTKSHFDQYNGKSNNIDSMARHSETTSRPSNFRPPSQEDFENFFQGMLDHFGNGRPNKSAQQNKNHDAVNQETHKDQKNITAFLDGHDGLRNGNVKKLVSLGSPERVDTTQQMQQHNMASDDEINPTYFKNRKAQKDQESEAIESFLSPNAPIYWTKRPFGNNSNLESEEQSQEDRPNSFKYPRPPFVILPSKQPNKGAARAHDAASTIIPFKGTRIMGGKISGGQISGGLIQGGQIKAGLIEGGVIKGGQVVGGHITNGTMEGGVVADGQMLGGHLVNGRIEGGRLMGGNVFGGKILGGTVEGGEMKGGVVAGGRFRGGSMQGGLLKGGEIQGGIIKGGKVEGGVVHGGNIEGGEFKFGDISGGTLKAGAMLGGVMKNGSIEGGTLKGGTIEGGVLKGGVMEGGQLKGGLVLAGKIKGGIIEGGVIEGGEIGDGVLITGGKVNATIIGTGSSIDKNQKLGELFKQGENSQQLGLKVDQQKYHHGGHKPVSGSNIMSDSLPGVPESTTANPGLKALNPNTNLKIPLREGTLKMLPQVSDSSDDDSLEKLLFEGKSANENNLEPELSSQRFFEEQDQPSRVVQKKGGKHHVVLDGVGFDLPNEDFVDLIDKMKNEDIINYYEQPERKEDLKIRHMPRPTKSATSLHIKPDDVEKKLSFPTKPRSSVAGTDKKKSQHDKMEEESPNVKNGEMKTVKLKAKDDERLRPTYHWSLNRLIKDRIPGSPGPAIRTHGEMKVIRGGLHLNGHNAWLGAGDFSGGCISDPDTCEDGLSFEMTFRLDKGALRYNDMSYIVDSGASTFNSKGFSLYTLQGNLRADLAIANQEFCLQIPVTVRKWQDILVTWKKSEGMRMYVNCELQGHAKGSEHCIGCHSKGCHVTDTNTLLMIGRPNYSPHFHCTKFDSGDISFWEKHLSAKDVETLCGAPTGETEKSSASLPAVILPEINQVKFPLQSINQAAYQDNVLQRYRANQPYFNRFTGLSSRGNDMSRQLFTPWSAWSACSKTCGAGFRARRRSCVNPKLLPGLCRGISIQHQSCFDRLCPAYPRTLPGRILSGQQSRLFAYNQASYFPGQFRYPFASRVNSDTDPTLTRALTTGGEYSEWSVWGTCDRSCGGGAQVRTRICNRPVSSGDGNMCHSLGPSIQVKRCNRKGCPVDGGYSQWSEFGACSKTCGTGGIQRRYRTCTNPAPINGGKPCFGHIYQSRVCRIGTCPVDGRYGTWSPWLPCDADCGGGIQERSRFCDNPVPQPGTKHCAVLGPDKETRLCNVFPCNVNF